MSLRRVDARFALPHAPRTAMVFDDLDGWREGLTEAGVDVAPWNPNERADLIVAPARAGEAVAAVGAPSVILDGRGGARALARGYSNVVRLLALPDRREPQVLVPLDRPRVMRYVLRQWSAPVDLRRRVRNAVADAVLSRRALPEIRPPLTVASQSGGPPFLVAGAAPYGVPRDVDWFVNLGHGDVLTRGVFQLFPLGSDSPEWALKFSRVAGYSAPFDREEQSLRLAAEGGDVVTAHAPRLLARFQSEGLHASLETAAVGTKLSLLLPRSGDRAAKERLVDAVAEWIIATGKATEAAPGALDDERARLREEIVPLWDRDELAGIVERIAAVPAVLQHNDLGCWNIIGSTTTFTAVDWESARRFGFPLWDLVYFLTDALVELDRAAHRAQIRDEHVRRLWSGELGSSRTLFQWIRRAADAFDLRPEDVGPIVTLGWLHHGSSYVRRREAAAAHGVVLDDAAGPDALRAARVWLATPGLGREWRAWRTRAT